MKALDLDVQSFCSLLLINNLRERNNKSSHESVFALLGKVTIKSQTPNNANCCPNHSLFGPRGNLYDRQILVL